MTPTKDQQAQEYAEKVNYPCPDYGWYESDDEQMKECLAQVWLDGYTACEQSMWRSVEEAMMNYMRNYETDMRQDDVDAIIEILKEKLPDTNTEKK